MSGGCVATMQRVLLVLISPRLARNQMTEGKENHLLPYLCLRLNRKRRLNSESLFATWDRAINVRDALEAKGGLIGSCGYDMQVAEPVSVASEYTRSGTRLLRLSTTKDT